MKRLLVALVITLFGSLSSLADDGTAQQQTAQFSAIAANKQQMTISSPGQLLQTLDLRTDAKQTPTQINDTVHWHFVGCVSSRHACRHHAADHGYHHHRTRHSSRRCHHRPHLACFGHN